MAQKKQYKQKKPPTPAANGQKILIVEDSITQAEKLKFILEGEGHSVDWVSNAQQALEYLENDTPHIIISDVLMPGMDGFELCNQIKQSQPLSQIPVMLLTALSEPHDIIRGLESGADHFITKPYQKDYLLTQVQYLMANAKLRQMSRSAASKMPEIGVDIFFAGKKHHITSSQLQILDLLFSTFEVFVQKNKELEEMNKQLIEKHEKIKALQGLVPICANCKKIRDDEGYWQIVEEYLVEHSDADFNLSICPRCAKIET
jgi:two-component system cell cycle response regulator